MMAGNNKIDRCAAVAIAAALCRLFDNSIATKARLPRKTATGQHVRRHHKEREIKAGIPLCQWNVATYIFSMLRMCAVLYVRRRRAICNLLLRR